MNLIMKPTLFITLLLLLAVSSARHLNSDETDKSKSSTNPPWFGPGMGRDGSGIPGYAGGNGWGNPGGGYGAGYGGPGGGYGAGYGGPSGGYTRGGIVRPSVVCKERGPCYKKKLTCPAKCFTSYSRSGRNYGGGGGGGGCTMDCKKNCVAYC